MKTITFKCTKDDTHFKLESGVTKSEALALQEQYSEKASFAEKIKMNEQFDSFYKSISEHSKTCDGLIAVDASSYRISD